MKTKTKTKKALKANPAIQQQPEVEPSEQATLSAPLGMHVLFKCYQLHLKALRQHNEGTK